MVAPKIDITQTASELLDVCDEAIVLPSLHMSNWLLRISHKIARMVYAFAQALKFPNCITAIVDFLAAL